MTGDRRYSSGAGTSYPPNEPPCELKSAWIVPLAVRSTEIHAITARPSLVLGLLDERSRRARQMSAAAPQLSPSHRPGEGDGLRRSVAPSAAFHSNSHVNVCKPRIPGIAPAAGGREVETCDTRRCLTCWANTRPAVRTATPKKRRFSSRRSLKGSGGARRAAMSGGQTRTSMPSSLPRQRPSTSRTHFAARSCASRLGPPLSQPDPLRTQCRAYQDRRNRRKSEQNTARIPAVGR